MVNSTVFDTNASIGQEDRNAAKICTQQTQNNPSVDVSARYTASSQKTPPPDGQVPLNTENTVTVDNIDDEDNTLCCSVPLDKVQGVLPTVHHPKFDEPKPTRKLLCLYCERSFASANLRSKHVERVHSVKKNRRLSSRKQQLSITPCIYCDKTDSSENTLKELFRHLVDEHSDKYFGCISCEERFLTSALLSDHHAALHPTVEIPRTAVKVAGTEEDDEDSVKLTRSRVKPKLDGENPKKLTVRSKNAKLKELRSKKLTVKSSRIAFNRRESKRLQALAKLTDAQKKKNRQKPENRKHTNSNKPESLNDKANKPTSICVNPYPEFDNFYRVKKITDHSIDNLKISSLTFDDVFDKAFFNRIKCNIEENLLHHIDGKLFKNEESESRISNFEKVSSAQTEIPNSTQDNYGCELSLNAVTPIAALSLNSQFGEDFESQIEYGSKPSKKKTQTKKDEVHYKYFTRRKFQASILEHKENRDLSKLDMWTQLVIKKRQQKIIDDKKTAKEIQEYSTCDEYKNKVKKEELNRILDRRGPFEDLREEASKKAALDKLNSVSEDSISHESFTEVRAVLNEILSRVFAVTEEPEEVVEQATNIRALSKPDLREIPSFLNLRRSSSLHTDDEIDQSDKITLICSSQDTENFELPTNAARGKNELIEMSGEWARCRLYICAACGAKLPNMKYLLEHKTIYHQNVWVQHYEFVGNQSELYRHLSIPALGKVGFVEDNAACKMWRRSEARMCSKCKKQCNTLGELHRHILECGGDWTWVLVRKKCKYRYGAKSRRKRRGMVLKVHHTKRKTDSTEKKKYTYNGPRQRPSDAETIQRMLADLPAKRSTRKLISLYDGVRRKQKSKELENVKQKKVKCGKVIYDRSSNIKETTEKTINTVVPRKKSQLKNKSSNVRALRSLGRVLSSRILDTSTKLTVKRKLKVFNERRRTRQSIVAEKDEDASQPSKDTRKLKIDASKDVTPKRTSPRSTKIVRTLKLFTGNANIKSFFPVKKRKVKKEVINEEEPKDAKTRSKKKPNETEDTIEPTIEKDGRLSTLVRSLSMNKKKIMKKATQDSPAEDSVESVKKTASNEELELTRRKRKLKQSFRNVINRVKRLKIDTTPTNLDAVQTPVKEKPQTAATSHFLDERTQEKELPAKIVIPSNIEAKENIADISETARTVIAFNDSNEDSPVPENIFKLDANEEKNLQAKGEPNFDTTTEIIKTEDDKDAEQHFSEGKLEPISIETCFKAKSVPMISPNVKGKIRKPARGLNDCIAMLTSKLQQKTEPLPKPSSSNVLGSTQQPKIVTDPSPQTAECILKIPTFKTQNETVEDVALDLSTKSRNKEPEELIPSMKHTVFDKESLWDFTRLTSVEKIIENVVSNKFQEPQKFLPPNLNSIDKTIQKVIDGHLKQQTTSRIRTTVDDIIDYVSNLESPIGNNSSSTPVKALVEDLKLPLLLKTKERGRKIGSVRKINKIEETAKGTNEIVDALSEKEEVMPETAIKSDDEPIETRISSTKEKVMKVARKIGQLRKSKKKIEVEQPKTVLTETHIDQVLDIKEIENKVPINEEKSDKIPLNIEDEPNVMENKTVISLPILVKPVELNLFITKEEIVNKEPPKVENKSNQNLRNFRKQNKGSKIEAVEEKNEKSDNSNSFVEETRMETKDIDDVNVNNLVPKNLTIKAKKKTRKMKKKVTNKSKMPHQEEPSITDQVIDETNKELHQSNNEETDQATLDVISVDTNPSLIISFKTKRKKKATKKLRFTKKKTRKSGNNVNYDGIEVETNIEAKNDSLSDDTLPLEGQITDEAVQIPSEDATVVAVEDKSNEDNFETVEPKENNRSPKKTPQPIKTKSISNIIKPAVLSITSILKRDFPKEETKAVDIESIIPTYELNSTSQTASNEPDTKFKRPIGIKPKKKGSKAKRFTMLKKRTFKFLPLTGIGGETESNTTISEIIPMEKQPVEDLTVTVIATDVTDRITMIPVENQERTDGVEKEIVADDTAKENIQQTDASKSSNIPEIKNVVKVNNVRPKKVAKKLKRGRPPKSNKITNNKIIINKEETVNVNLESTVEESNEETTNLSKIEFPSSSKALSTDSESKVDHLNEERTEEKRKMPIRKSKLKKLSCEENNSIKDNLEARNDNVPETISDKALTTSSLDSLTMNTAIDIQNNHSSRTTTRSLEDLNALNDQDKPFTDFTQTSCFKAEQQKNRFTRTTRSLENLTKIVEEEIEGVHFTRPKSRLKKTKKPSENVKETLKDSEKAVMTAKTRNKKLSKSSKYTNLFEEQNDAKSIHDIATEDTPLVKDLICIESAEIADTLELNEDCIPESIDNSVSDDNTKIPTRTRGRMSAIKNLNNSNEELPFCSAEEVSNSTEISEELSGRPKRSKSLKKSLKIETTVEEIKDRPKSAVSLGLTEESKSKFKRKTKPAKKLTKSASLENLNTCSSKDTSKIINTPPLEDSLEYKIKEAIRKSNSLQNSVVTSNVSISIDCQLEPAADQSLEISKTEDVADQKLTTKRKLRATKVNIVDKLDEESIFEDEIRDMPKRSLKKKLTKKQIVQESILTNQEQEEDSVFEDELRQVAKSTEQCVKKKIGQEEGEIQKESVFEDEIRHILKKSDKKKSSKSQIMQEEVKNIKDTLVDEENNFEDEISHVLKKSYKKKSSKSQIMQEQVKSVEEDTLVDEDNKFEDEISHVLKKSYKKKSSKSQIMQEQVKSVEEDTLIGEDNKFEDEISHVLKNSDKKKSYKSQIIQEEIKSVEDTLVDEDNKFEEEISKVLKKSDKKKSSKSQIMQEEVKSVEEDSLVQEDEIRHVLKTSDKNKLSNSKSIQEVKSVVDAPVEEDNKFEDEIIEVPRISGRSTRNKTNKEDNLVTETEEPAEQEEGSLFKDETRHVKKCSKKKPLEDQFPKKDTARNEESIEVQLDEESAFEDELRHVQKRNNKKKTTKNDVEVQDEFSSPIKCDNGGLGLRKTRSSTNLISSNESLMKLNDSLDAEVSKIMEFSEFITPDQKISNTSTFMNSSQSEGSPYKFKRASRRSKNMIGNSILFRSEESLSMTNSENVTPADMSPITNLSESEGSPQKYQRVSRNLKSLTSYHSEESLMATSMDMSNESETLPPKAKRTGRNSKSSVLSYSEESIIKSGNSDIVVSDSSPQKTKRTNKKSKKPAATSVSSRTEESLNNSENANPAEPADDFLSQKAARPLRRSTKNLTIQKEDNSKEEKMLNPCDNDVPSQNSVYAEEITTVEENIRCEEIFSANDSKTDQIKDGEENTSSEGSDVKLLEEKIRNAIRQSLISMSDTEERDIIPSESSLKQNEDKEDLSQQPIDVIDDSELKEDSLDQQTIKKPKRNRKTNLSNKKVVEIADVSKINHASTEIEMSTSRSLRRKSAINYAEIEESKEVTDDLVTSDDKDDVKPSNTEETEEINNAAILDDTGNETINESIDETIVDEKIEEIDLKSKEDTYVLKENLTKNTLLETNTPVNKKRAKLRPRKGKKRLIRNRKTDIPIPEVASIELPTVISENVLTATNIETEMPEEITVEKEPPIKIIINKHIARRKSKSIKKVGLKGHNDLYEDFALVIKKKRRAPFITFSPPDTFSKEDTYPMEVNNIPKPLPELEKDLDESVEEMDMELDEIPIKTNIIETPKLDLPLIIPINVENESNDKEIVTPKAVVKRKKGKSRVNRKKSIAATKVVEDLGQPEEIPILKLNLKSNDNYFSEIINGNTPIVSNNQITNFMLDKDDFSSDDFEIDNSFEDSIISLENNTPKQPSVDAETLFNKLIENTEFVKPLILKKTKIFRKKSGKKSKNHSHFETTEDDTSESELEIDDALIKTPQDDLTDNLSAADASFEVVEEEDFLKPLIKSTKKSKRKGDKRKPKSKNENLEDLNKNSDIIEALSKEISQIEEKLSANFEEESTFYSKKSWYSKTDELAKDDIDKLYAFSETEDLELEKPIELPRRLPRKNDNLEKQNDFKEKSVLNKKQPRRKSKISTTETVDLNFSGVFSEDRTSETKPSEELSEHEINNTSNILTEFDGRKSLRNAKIKALENIHDEALAELTDGMCQDKKSAKEIKIINDIDIKCNKKGKKLEKNINNFEFSANLFTNSEITDPETIKDSANDQKVATLDVGIKKLNKKQKKIEKPLQITEMFNFSKEVFNRGELIDPETIKDPAKDQKDTSTNSSVKKPNKKQKKNEKLLQVTDTFNFHKEVFDDDLTHPEIIQDPVEDQKDAIMNSSVKKPNKKQKKAEILLQVTETLNFPKEVFDNNKLTDLEIVKDPANDQKDAITNTGLKNPNKGLKKNEKFLQLSETSNFLKEVFDDELIDPDTIKDPTKDQKDTIMNTNVKKTNKKQKKNEKLLQLTDTFNFPEELLNNELADPEETIKDPTKDQNDVFINSSVKKTNKKQKKNESLQLTETLNFSKEVFDNNELTDSVNVQEDVSLNNSEKKPDKKQNKNEKLLEVTDTFNFPKEMFDNRELLDLETIQDSVKDQKDATINSSVNKSNKKQKKTDKLLQITETFKLPKEVLNNELIDPETTTDPTKDSTMNSNVKKPNKKQKKAEKLLQLTETLNFSKEAFDINQLTNPETIKDPTTDQKDAITNSNVKKLNKKQNKNEKLLQVTETFNFPKEVPDKEITDPEITKDPANDQKDSSVKKTNKKQKKSEKLIQLTEKFNFPKEVFNNEAPLLEDLVAELDGLEELENSIERELNAEITKENKETKNECSKEQLDNSMTNEENQELRRSRRGSRKVASYNENDLIDPLIDALESKRNKKKEDKAKKEAEKKLNSEQLFDLLKASSVDNLFVPKQQNSFLNSLEDSSREVTDDNFDNVFENMLEKSALLTQNKGDVDKIYEFTNNVESLNEDEPKVKIAKKSKKIEDIEQISISQDSTSKSDNFCEICNKYFVKLENLIKHRRTLTHIQKLSELEAKEAEKSKIISQHEDENSRESVIEPPYLPGDLKIDILTNKDDIQSPFNTNHSLKLADIISDVLNKPVLPCIDEEPNTFSDIILQNDTKRYKSLGERKSFDSESLLTSETHMTEPTKTILEKQISLLENIIENQTANNYIDDISSSSEKTDIPTEPGSPITSTPITVNSFAKPIQYEEISEDSANNRNYDDQKLRKTLNRDEELFLECCSLLKSSSEVSSSYSSKKPNEKKIRTLNLKSIDAPKWLTKADILEKIDSNAINDYSDNSRIPTPLGNSYDDNGSNSNTISSSWGMDRSVDEKHEEVEGASTSFSFERVAVKKNEDHDSGARFVEILPNNIRTEFLINEKPSSHRSSTDEISDGLDNKKIMTKGARKVFEGLKVSIPTEELNMEEVLNSSPKQKKPDLVPEKNNEEEKLCSPTSKRKSKPVKKEVGSNLLFKVSKKKLPSPTVPKDQQDDKGYDVYDFEETQDNTDVFTKPNYRAFRSQAVGENENESETESLDNTEPEPVIVVTSATKKSKAQENITKKKCMIMGRIFKNAAKSKIDDIDEEIRTIPVIDNEELVENYVAECTKVIKESTVKEVINCEPEEIKQTTKPSKSDTKKPEIKKKVKQRGKKRVRTNSDSTDDEFSICKTNKRKTNRKNAKEEDNCINLEQELKECIGVASRKSQRKCTSGKQNVLVEYWSSDDSQFEALLENRIITVKQVETVIPEPEVVPAVMQPPPEVKKPVQKKSKKSKSLDHSVDNNSVNRRKRAAVNPLYHWSSSSEDESNDLIEVKPLREGLDEDEDRPVQHGWIVGDSPKKLVTMLAQAKGKKADIDSVKEQGKKRTNTVS